MRQVLLQVPHGTGDELMGPARELGAATLTRLEGTSGDGDPVDVFVMTVPNAAVDELIDRADALGAIEASIPASGAYAFEPPADEPPQQLLDITPRSAYEVVLAGQQAAGSWKGFLTYSAVAGAVVWLGLFTETIYLLTASMLIAPFAGPAMNTAIALVSGRPGQLRHALLRYAAGIGLTAAVASGLTFAFGQETVTSLMASVLTITIAAVLLPLAAGTAGAMFQLQSEHSSLISGAAVGLLVAASLAPPAGGLGIALALGRYDLAVHAVFLIGLQLTGITASATAVLVLYGIRPGSGRFRHDRTRLLRAGWALAAFLTAGLVALQLAVAPYLSQGTEARDSTAIVDRVLAGQPAIQVLSVDPRVAPATPGDRPRILVQVMVERSPSAPPADELRPGLETAIEARLRAELGDVVPHVDVTVFDPPA